MSHDEARRIFDVARSRPTLIDAIIARYVSVNPLIGLRPSEWPHAKLVQNQWLVVANGKASNYRANGDFRLLDLGQLPGEARQRVRELIMMIREAVASAGSWEHLRDVVSARLARICRKARIERVCLYAFRGTAAARLKRMGITRSELAAILGHASDGTAQKHYPRARDLRGWPTKLVIGVAPQCVDRVRTNYRTSWLDGMVSRQFR
ncbi:hypothetical protein MXD81_37035 [Microbacteriaceae bacterium K1510]|nr:hypothetical protein [Microbacteriaceae bacterium K1510]